MKKPGTSILQIIIYDDAASRSWPDALRFDVCKALLDRGYGVTCTCELAPPDNDPRLILGLFHNSNLPSQGAAAGRASIFKDVSNFDAQGIVQLVEQVAERVHGTPTASERTSWFPVIDYDRCTHCMDCLSFCLFGVYAISSKKEIAVRHPEKCKPDCPACSRVCPEAAIIFPKYSAAPINGAEVDGVAPEKIKVDVSALLGGDLYRALRDRSQRVGSRFSGDRDEQLAHKERQRYLSQLKDQLDIPDHVLDALPPKGRSGKKPQNSNESKTER